MANFSIGVDLGGTNLRIAAVEESGRLLESITTGTEVSRGRESVVGGMCDAIRTLSSKFLAQGELLGIGIGIPGAIDMERGMIRESPNFPGWDDYPVQHEIEKRLNTRVILENDANAAAMGEKWLGAAREHDDMCMLTLGTGVGGGVVLNGMIWHGMTGMAGEIGHTTAFPDGVMCGCGNQGCVEQYASATAVKRMAMEAIATGKAPELGRAMAETSELTAKQVYQLAIEGDAPAREIFRVVGQALGMALATAVNVFNLPTYVVGGGVSAAWDMFAPAMMSELRKRSFIYRVTTPEGSTDKTRTIVTRATLGGDAGLLGAARLPMIGHKHALAGSKLR